VSNIIVKHRHGLVTECHHLPMVLIVPQSAPMVSDADASVKLYLQYAVLGFLGLRHLSKLTKLNLSGNKIKVS